MSEHHRSKEWSSTVRTNRPRLQAQLPLPCIDCNRLVLRGQKWHVGHVISAAQAKLMGWTVAQINHPSNLGASHVHCNVVAGGKLGAAMTNKKKREDKRLLQW